MSLASATRLGPYEILCPLASGSMGEVYKARDTRLDRLVAIKLLRPKTDTDIMRQRRFEQEARAASALNHPNILTIHDIGHEGGISYIVSEYVEGESLRSILEQGPMSIPQLLDLATQITDGLAAAHEAGIIHRDLKPENIMVARDGRVKILDFGLAKPLLESAALSAQETTDQRASKQDVFATEPGLILGTVGYMSPEQAAGRTVSYTSDQFSLGVILHEMATGRQPFRRENPLQTLLAIANVEQIPFTPGPVGFRRVVEQCLAKDPDERFSSTSEIYRRIKRVRNELARSPAPLVSAQKLSNTRRSLLTRAGAVLLATFLGLAGFAYTRRPLAQAANPPVSTEQSGPEAAPYWSPDASQIYFISDTKLMAASAAGGVPRVVLDNVTGAALSPGGDMLAVLRKAGEPGSSAPEIWVVPLTGGEPRELTPEVTR